MSTPLPEKYILPSVLPDRCTSAWGEDRYGIWSEVEIFGVTQRFRWIPPGEFMMGSPEDEPERLDRETQHPVVLTNGYWLADTACTQELWQAVTGDDPSRFRGKKRPVERLRWDDCKAFVDRVNSENPGLQLSFPTEAQWEYACRAGTKTPFSCGENITPEQVNYNGNNPYAGGAKGEYREKTIDVKSLPQTPWGLYDMHGNVWEWCRDWYGEYPSDKVVDPTGPDAGDFRVLRGGSWSAYGGGCRSAYRNLSAPGYRHVNIGFRLSRGQVAQTRAAEPGSEES